MITHTVFFKLRNPEAEDAFFEKSRVLEKLPGVQNFRCLRQISSKNGFDYGFAMEFADQPAYDGYNIHPLHVAFVRDTWVPEVQEFLEIDYVARG